MNGVINLNKPAGKTSHDMVYFLRRLTHIKRIGHTGTLDPDATGVLPMCIGVATKAAEFICDGTKCYRANMILGSATTTQDSSGEVVKTADVNISEADFASAVKQFTGKIKQIPPMYSAVKVGGKKLYELAREGKEIERKSREIEIYSIDICKLDIENKLAVLDIECSKGTYIRTLCNDIGEALGCFAHMDKLVRTKSSNFTIDKSYTVGQLEELAAQDRLYEALISLDKIFAQYNRYEVGGDDEFKIRNGTPIDACNVEDNEIVRVYGENGEFLCISQKCDEKLRMLKSFWT